VVKFHALLRHGTIGARDLEFVHRTDTVDDACVRIVRQLDEHALGQPAARRSARLLAA